MIRDIDGRKITAKTKAAQMVYDAINGRMSDLLDEVLQESEDCGYKPMTENEENEVKKHLQKYLERLDSIVFHKAMDI